MRPPDPTRSASRDCAAAFAGVGPACAPLLSVLCCHVSSPSSILPIPLPRQHGVGAAEERSWQPSPAEPRSAALRKGRVADLSPSLPAPRAMSEAVKPEDGPAPEASPAAGAADAEQPPPAAPAGSAPAMLNTQPLPIGMSAPQAGAPPQMQVGQLPAAPAMPQMQQPNRLPPPRWRTRPNLPREG